MTLYIYHAGMHVRERKRSGYEGGVCDFDWFCGNGYALSHWLLASRRPQPFLVPDRLYIGLPLFHIHHTTSNIHI